MLLSTWKLWPKKIPKFLGVSAIKYNFPRSASQSENTLDVKEMKMEVPWGHVAGRLWNGSDPTRKPVICLHGWKDNAATWVGFDNKYPIGNHKWVNRPWYNSVHGMKKISNNTESNSEMQDTLLPILIPKVHHLQFLAIDLPGHGLSSHFPAGMLYHARDCLVLISRIMLHYQWDKISILAHSYGGQLGFLYAGTHNESVDNYVSIDGMTPMVFSREDLLTMLPIMTEEMLKFETKLKITPKSKYPYDVIVKKVMERSLGALTTEAAKILLTRGCKETSPGSGLFEFTHDIRVQHMPILSYSERQLGAVAENFRCHVLHIMASQGVKYMSPYMLDNLPIWLKSKNDRGVYFEEVESSSHHPHLISPEKVEPIITKLLSQK